MANVESRVGQGEIIRQEEVVEKPSEPVYIEPESFSAMLRDFILPVGLPTYKKGLLAGIDGIVGSVAIAKACEAVASGQGNAAGFIAGLGATVIFLSHTLITNRE